MNAKQIIEKFKKFKYHNRKLELIEEKAMGLEKSTDKQRKQFIEEVEIITAFMMCNHYENAMDTYDILVNPHQKITKAEIIAIVTSEQTKNTDVVKRGGLAFCYIEKDQFAEYRKAYRELTK